MPDIIVTLRVNPEFDPEIADLLKDIPRRKRSEFVRQVLRDRARKPDVLVRLSKQTVPIAEVDKITYAPAEDNP